MKEGNRKFSGQLAANIIQFFALIFLIIQVVSQCNELDYQRSLINQQSANLDSLNYQINANTFKPVLKIIGEPKFFSFVLKYDYAELNMNENLPKKTESLRKSEMENDTIPPRIVQVRAVGQIMGYRIGTRMKLTNIGNTKAKILFLASLDTSSSNTLLRSILFERDHNFQEHEILSSTKFNDEILPADTLELEVNYFMKFTGNKEKTIHVIIVYENEFNNVYDSYSWAIYSDLPLKIEDFVYPDEISYGIHELDVYRTIDSKCKFTKSSYHVYKKNESDKIRQVIKDIVTYYH